MASLLKRIAPVFPAVAILAVFFSTSGLARLRSNSGRERHGMAPALADRSAIPSTWNPQAYMESFGSCVTSLGTARSELLQQAAQDSGDLEKLQAASQAYRCAIIQLRSKIAELEQELGPDEAQRLVGMMMYYTMSNSQRVLGAEILGELEADGQSSRQ